MTEIALVVVGVFHCVAFGYHVTNLISSIKKDESGWQWWYACWSLFAASCTIYYIGQILSLDSLPQP